MANVITYTYSLKVATAYNLKYITTDVENECKNQSSAYWFLIKFDPFTYEFIQESALNQMVT